MPDTDYIIQKPVMSSSCNPQSTSPVTSPESTYASSSSSQYSLDAKGHFVLAHPKRKMDDIQLISVDAARYSSRHKTWRRTSKSARIVVEPLPSTVKIVTWNVDFSAANAKIRLKAALSHIQHDVLDCKSGERPPPCCILLQEVLRVSWKVAILVPSDELPVIAGGVPHYPRR